MTASISVLCDVYCATCGEKLIHTDNPASIGGIVRIFAQSCHTCIMNAKDESYQKGQEKGYDAGYDDGYAKGYDNGGCALCRY